jgi:hypothetical protein
MPAVRVGVVKLAPEAMAPGAVALSVAVFPEQIVTPAAVGATGVVLTVTTTGVLAPVQPAIVDCT